MTTLLPPFSLVKNIILKSVESKGVLHRKMTSSFWNLSSYGMKAETTNSIKMIPILGDGNILVAKRLNSATMGGFSETVWL
jgi:hypothetical protein